MPVQCSGHPSESVDPVAGGTSLFETGDDGLGGLHAFGEFPLTEAGFGAQGVDELSEGEVLLESGSGLGRRGRGACP